MPASSPTISPPRGLAQGDLVDEPLYEVVDGIEVNPPIMGVYEGFISSLLGRKLGNFVEEHNLGQVVNEVLFRIFPEETRMRRPDVAYVSFERWGREEDLPAGNGWAVVPELAVEVVSPTDLAVEVMAKVYEYFAAGVVEVWLVYPELRRVHRFGPATGISSVGPEGILDGGSLLPGFQLPLTALFRNKA